MESYETVAFTAPDRPLEIFYLEPSSADAPANGADADSGWTADGPAQA